jgi:tetratricopeptide (TPR) repeat protein
MADEGAGRELSGPEQGELCEALLKAFPTPDELTELVLVGLDENLHAIAKESNLRSAFLQLIQHTESHGRTSELFDAVLARRPKLTELRALVARLRGKAPAAADPSGPSTEHVSISRLPVPGKYLFGRDKELAQLDAAWSDPRVHIVSIVAMGGAGKTALVDWWLKAMEREGWRGAERVYGWSFYSQGSSNTASGDTFLAEALRWFGNTEPVPLSAWDRGVLLAKLVKQHKTLLVLDGLEPLQAPPGVDGGKIRDQGVAALVRELAAGGRGLCVISTRLAIYDLGSREDGPAPKIDLDKLSPEDGAKLLEVLGAKGTHKELVDAAAEMKGHALALTLLGSYLADACEGDIRKRREIGLLEGDMTGGEHAKRAMAAYARWFGEGPDIAVLRLLGLFDRPADAGCIKALRAAPAILKLTESLVGMSDTRWNQTLAKLRRAHLVAEASEGEHGTIDAHPLVREHFGARLREEAPEAWREGHGRLFEHLQKVAPEFPEDTLAMAPLYAAVVHGCLAGRRQKALDDVLKRRVNRESEFFDSKKLGAFGARLGMLAAFFDPQWTRLAPGLTETAAAFVLGNAGFALRALGRLDEAAEPMRLALDKAVAQDAWKNASAAAGNLSELHLARGAVREAVEAARQSIELADRSGDWGQRMGLRTTLADTLHQAGSLDEARSLFEEAETLQQKQQPKYPRLYSLQGFRYCDLLLGQGRIEDVLDRARQTLDWVTQQRWLLDIALDHLSLGRGHLALAFSDRPGNLATARAELDHAVTGFRQAGQQDELPRGLLARAELHLATSDLPAAERDLEEALSIAARSGMRLFEADAHLGFTRLHLARRDPIAARKSLSSAKVLIERTGYRRRNPELASLEEALLLAEKS